MFSRITLLLLALFWLTMTYLLWRSEYVGHNQAGSVVPAELVWRKVLTAPDNSSLEIMHNGRKVGYCRLASNIGQELDAGRFLNEGLPPENNADRSGGYRLDLEGNIALDAAPGRLKFDFEIKMNTNREWQEFNLQFRLKPSLWQIHSKQKEQTIDLLMEGPGSGRTERVFKFSDFQNPQVLMQEFDMPAALGLLGAFSPTTGAKGKDSLSLALDWKARNDWIQIGHSSVRAYRLEAMMLDRYRMLILVSRVGEILRVELPDGWELINDQLIAM
jgi:hypothetical protein